MSPNPRLQRYLVAVEYIGSRFSGSQKQLNGRTVVGVLEEAFRKFIGQPVSISLSSRTDAGVHALSNVCHVDVERISKRKPGEVLPPHEPAVVRKAVNHFLQKNEGYITVIDVQCVLADFHARFKAQECTMVLIKFTQILYFYLFLSEPEPLSTFEKDRAWHVPEDLDLFAMQEACKVLVGHHDFSSFRASGCQEYLPISSFFGLYKNFGTMASHGQAKSPIRTLDELSVSEMVSTPHIPSVVERAHSVSNGEDPQSDCNPTGSVSINDVGFGIRRKHRCFVVTACARSFLYHQVRLLVGVLKSVGTGDLTVSDAARILDAKSITAASPMAPASGLCLGLVKNDIP